MPNPLGLIDCGGRLTAWEIILKHDLKSLPVNPFIIAEQNNIQVLTYQQLAESTGNTVEYYESKFNSSAFSYSVNNQLCIAYKAQEHMDMGCLRWSVMHELCHLFLDHHTYINQVIERDDTAELQANRLARRILAPSIVLHMCGCSSPEEIASMCGIPDSLARQRYQHLQDLRRRDAFLIMDDEKNTLNSFQGFVSSYLVKKYL